MYIYLSCYIWNVNVYILLWVGMLWNLIAYTKIQYNILLLCRSMYICRAKNETIYKYFFSATMQPERDGNTESTWMGGIESSDYTIIRTTFPQFFVPSFIPHNMYIQSNFFFNEMRPS